MESFPKIKDYLRLLRVKNWIKNILVFAPLLFSGNLTNTTYFLQGVFTFFGFCFLSSSCYVLNDWVDRRADRIHPRKSSRPLAKGTVSKEEACAVGILSFVLSFCFIYTLPAAVQIHVFAVFFGYAFLQLLYNLILKNVFMLDLIVIASGYVLRAVAGGAAIQIPITNWFLLSVFLVSFLLITGKRRSDLVGLSERTAIRYRPVLKRYSVSFLNQLITFSASASFVIYCLYTLSGNFKEDVSEFEMVFSILFVIYGLTRYLHLIYEHERGGRPEELFWNDRPIQISIIGWILYIILIFYL